MGRVPNRWATADGFILSYDMGVFFDSSKSQWVMGLLQLMVMPGVFFAGGGRRRGFRASSACSGSRDWDAIFFWILCVVWLLQLHLYPSSTSLYLYA
jgi:hypothetical protein